MGGRGQVKRAEVAGAEVGTGGATPGPVVTSTLTRVAVTCLVVSSAPLERAMEEEPPYATVR